MGTEETPTPDTGDMVGKLEIRIGYGYAEPLTAIAAEITSCYNEGRAAGYDVDHVRLHGVNASDGGVSLIFLAEIIGTTEADPTPEEVASYTEPCDGSCGDPSPHDSHLTAAGRQRFLGEGVIDRPDPGMAEELGVEPGPDDVRDGRGF